MVLFDGDVIVHTIDDGAIIDSGAAAAVLDATRALGHGRKPAVVVDLRAVGFADRAARDSFASDPGRPTAVSGDPEAVFVWAPEQVQAHRNR